MSRALALAAIGACLAEAAGDFEGDVEMVGVKEFRYGEAWILLLRVAAMFKASIGASVSEAIVHLHADGSVTA